VSFFRWMFTDYTPHAVYSFPGSVEAQITACFAMSSLKKRADHKKSAPGITACLINK
jgi:hypothetical protein